jgi:ribonuclease G
MSKEMIISVNGREKKIAILDNGLVTEFYIERGDEENSGIVGNIYKGRVQRVLPGMQSAFVGIGLERDGFLYVSDFFDEEEEIERIVMEKSKKSTPEDAAREATDRVQRARLEREKQMEAAQDIAEPLLDAKGEVPTELENPEIITEELPVDETLTGEQQPEQFDENRTDNRRGKSSRRGNNRNNEGRDRDFQRREPLNNKEKAADQITFESKNIKESTEEKDFPSEMMQDAFPLFETDDSGFERIIDDEDTGEMFKDAYMQEAIIDQVRAVEFDMESEATAEVGSLIGAVSNKTNGFERIADDDDNIDEPQERKTAEINKSRNKRGSRGGRNRNKSGRESTPDDKVAADETQTSEASNQNREPESEENKRSPNKKSSGLDSKVEKEAETTSDSKSKSSASKAKTKKPVSKNKKIDDQETLADGEASVRESNKNAKMAVRRGGRGRRRPGDRDGGGDDTPPANQPPSSEDKVSNVPEASPTAYQPDNRRGGGNSRNNRDRNQPTITDLLREGQEILVQIAKEPIAKKGARITSHIALPGRFLVYMPTIEHLGVSRKIESASERNRLRILIQKIKQEETVPSGGFIVRTAGIGISEEDLRQDARYLISTWLDVKKTSEKAKSPALVHQDLDIIQRLLRDQLSDEFTAIRVDSEEEYQRIVEFVNRIQPRLVNRVKLYTRDEPILENYGVQEEISKALKPRVWLRSGGYLVINQTEALVAIDVNTGKFVGKGNARLEDTITKTNMEAVEEIARQIRLRDLGGIIVLDLIDMEDRRNRFKVQQALQEALASDKSPNKVLSFNDFGLIIMTRKRVKQSLERTMCAPCDYCEGAGWVKSPQTVCFEILEEARRLARTVNDVRQTTLRVHPDVAKSLHESERMVLQEIEDYLGSVDVTGDKTIHLEQFDFAFV